jgi:phospho-N-acetylmuramoyl-pentapeptide-transferase
MLYALLYPLHQSFGAFNVFKYITFRGALAGMTSIVLSMWLGPFFIRYLERSQLGQSVRSDGPATHLVKAGTPTMGGVLILFNVLIPTLLWADLRNPSIHIALWSVLSFGLIGFIDDYKKVIQKNPKGLSFRQKMFWQTLSALGLSFWIYSLHDGASTLHFPFLKEYTWTLGAWFIPFATFVIVGSSNAVNLTDGLDGLAVGPVMTVAGTFTILAYCAGHLRIAEYLQIPHVAVAGEMAIFAACLGAACLGFLWFNTYPAQVFMGDVGSLPLGAALAVVALISKNEILLAWCGGIFVIEALSVMAQVLSFKLTGKRVLRMAPLHHHFELKGWAEPKVIVRFWIISILLALTTLSTLKLR